MLDRFVYGGVERISPEAPVPVLRTEREQALLAGVGHGVRNPSAQAASVCLVPLPGRDAAARELKRLLRADVSIERHPPEEGNRHTPLPTPPHHGAHQNQT